MKKLLLTILFTFLLANTIFASDISDQINRNNSYLEHHKKNLARTDNYCAPYTFVKFGTRNNQPIEWFILAKENGRALLLSRYTFGYERNIVPLDTSLYNYKNSIIITKLNEYYNNYFSEDEKKYILDTENVSKCYRQSDLQRTLKDFTFDEYEVDSCTTEKLFLPSLDEMIKYTCPEEYLKEYPYKDFNDSILFFRADLVRVGGEDREKCYPLRDFFYPVSYNKKQQMAYKDCFLTNSFLANTNGGDLRPAMWVKYDQIANNVEGIKNDISDVREKAKKQVPEMHAAGCSNEVKEISDEEMDALLKKFGIK